MTSDSLMVHIIYAYKKQSQMGSAQSQRPEIVQVSEEGLRNRIELLEIGIRNTLKHEYRYKRSSRQKDKQIVRLEALLTDG